MDLLNIVFLKASRQSEYDISLCSLFLSLLCCIFCLVLFPLKQWSNHLQSYIRYLLKAEMFEYKHSV